MNRYYNKNRGIIRYLLVIEVKINYYKELKMCKIKELRFLKIIYLTMIKSTNQM